MIHKSNQLQNAQLFGSGTPMPNSPISSSPTWDLSSWTPMVTPELHIEPVLPSITQHSCIQHPLLDPQLVGKKLKVVATGGSFKEKDILVDVVLMGEQLSIQHTNYKTSEFLSPKWIFPKHSNPTHDNGLLIVIHGEHW